MFQRKINNLLLNNGNSTVTNTLPEPRAFCRPQEVAKSLVSKLNDTYWYVSSWSMVSKLLHCFKTLNIFTNMILYKFRRIKTILQGFFFFFYPNIFCYYYNSSKVYILNSSLIRSIINLSLIKTRYIRVSS